jgi:MSHA biogenesis protein MshE
MFQDAVQVRASDLHIEPGENALRVRQRVDGVLQEQKIDGRRVAGALVTRLKLMSGLDIAEKRLPQDGRFSLKVKDKTIDVRHVHHATQYGESVVMRLLDQSASLMTLDRLGHVRSHAGQIPQPDQPQCGHGAGDRAHRQRQDHHAVLGTQLS